METIFSTASTGRLSANDPMPNKSATTELDFGHLTTPIFCIKERSQMLVDESTSECSDSENGDDNKWGTDSSLMALCSFTRPPSPRLTTSSHYNSTGSPWEPQNESDTLHKLIDNWSQICSGPQCVSLESEVGTALGSPTSTSAHPSPQCLSNAPREDYLGSHVLESGQIENNHTTSIDMGILPPTSTPAVATADSPTGERRDNIHQISATRLQSLHAKLKCRPSRSTSVIGASEASNTQGHEIESPHVNHPSVAMPSGSHPRQEDSPPSTAANSDEEPFNPSHAEPAAQDPVNLQTQRPPIASRKTSVTSSHSVYIVPRVPRLYYKHDSPSCWSILTNLLTNPIHRLRTRKRSVRESTAMDQELRELHARMRETEMRMKQDGTRVAQPPQYVDVQKDGAAATTHETMETRPDGDAR